MLKLATAAVFIAAQANAVKWTWPELLAAPGNAIEDAGQTLIQATLKMTQASDALKEAPVDAASLAGLHELKCEYKFQREVEMWAACAHVALLDYIDGHFGINTTPDAYERWYGAYHACSTEVDGYVTAYWVDSGPCTGFHARRISMPAITWPESLITPVTPIGPIINPGPVIPPIQPPVKPPAPPVVPSTPKMEMIGPIAAGIYTMEGGDPYETAAGAGTHNICISFLEKWEHGVKLHWQSNVHPNQGGQIHSYYINNENLAHDEVTGTIAGDTRILGALVPSVGKVMGKTRPSFQIGNGIKWVLTGTYDSNTDIMEAGKPCPGGIDAVFT